jgi:hypothetical protein
MSADTDLDVFDAPSDAPAKGALITAGRYRIPNRDGSHRKGGLMRVTNLAGAMSDQRALQLWGERQVAIGLRSRPDFYEELTMLPLHKMDDDQTRSAVQEITNRAKEAAKSDAGARRGTARHDMIEQFHVSGERQGTPEMLSQLDQYVRLLDVHRLAAVTGMQERVIVCEALGVAGRLDNMLRCLLNGTVYIGDLKTHKGFYSWLEIAIQLACYSRADHIYNPVDGTFEDFPSVDMSTAIVAHVPSIGAPVELYDIDIDTGWKFAQVARHVCDIRSKAKAKGGGVGRVRQIPGTPPWADRIRAATCREDGKKIIAAMRRAGAYTAEMQVLAREHAATLEK